LATKSIFSDLLTFETIGALTFTAEHPPACYYHKYALFFFIIRKLAKNKEKNPKIYIIKTLKN